jgi:hypothetical protein
LHGEVLPATKIMKYPDGILGNIADALRHRVYDSFTSGIPTKQTLSAFYGKCFMLWGGFRANDSSGTSNAYRTYTAIGAASTIELLDGNSQNIVGGSAISVNKMRFLNFSRMVPGNVMQALPLFWLPLGDCSGIRNGVPDGFTELTGTHQPIVVPNATGTYSLCIYGYFWIRLQIQDGRIIVGK